MTSAFAGKVGTGFPQKMRPTDESNAFSGTVDTGFATENATHIESRALFADQRCQLMVAVDEECCGVVRRTGQDGFTLVEVVAALAIASVIILATAALVHHVALYFDRGTRGVNNAERVVLAIERLAADFGSARFVPRATTTGTAAAFSAESGAITFVGAAGVGPGAQGEEVVTLTIEQSEGIARLIRRRAAWRGPRTRFEDLAFGDAVTLLEGKVDIAFLFGRFAPDTGLTWHNGWIGEAVLPRFVRLILRDRATGTDLLAEADFDVRSDVTATCGQASVAACTSIVGKEQGRPSDAGRPTQ
jgi:prepilin-type N-terminal cleavage/methylation domain-containing protein